MNLNGRVSRLSRIHSDSIANDAFLGTMTVNVNQEITSLNWWKSLLIDFLIKFVAQLF